MEISRRYQYLVLSFDLVKQQHRIKIYESLPIAIEEWGASSRISPIFGVREFGTGDAHVGFPSGDHDLIFLGPVKPSLVSDAFSNSFRLWLSLGLFNVIISTDDNSVTQNVIKWADHHKIRYESWSLQDNILKKFYFSPVLSG